MWKWQDDCIDPLYKAIDPHSRKVIDWAREKLGFNVLMETSPNKSRYQGNGVIYLDDAGELLLTHEIGHYVVVSSQRRNLVDYGLYFYTPKQLMRIWENEKHNCHTIEDCRATTYASYLGKMFKTDDFSTSLLSMPHYKSQLQQSTDWLHSNDLIDADNIPTGKLYNGEWKLDNPFDILEGL